MDFVLKSQWTSLLKMVVFCAAVNKYKCIFNPHSSCQSPALLHEEEVLDELLFIAQQQPPGSRVGYLRVTISLSR